MEFFDISSQTLLNLTNQEVIVYILIGFIVLVSVLLLLRSNNSYINYRIRDNLLSNAEHSFFLVLKQALIDDYEIFTKVRIADVLTPESTLSKKDWNKAFYKISSKHFDYVLCDKDSLLVVAVIELDDKSHNQPNVKKRDAFVEKACLSAGLKLLRFRCRSSYDSQAIRDFVLDSLNK